MLDVLIDIVHYQVMKDCDALLKQNQHIDVDFQRSNDTAKKANYTHVNGSVDVARLCRNKAWRCVVITS
jgi:hypothetical protein